ncbi:hypothetical protein, partial [Streptomyces acidiscabies]|uniref:hypothetical protein n=1 Tax=Streptomyces acidiscabies TaxID=42234 RepID=UPI0038F817E3
METIQDIRGTAVIRKEPLPGWRGSDSTAIDKIGKIDPIPNPYGADDVGCGKSEFKKAGIDLQAEAAKPITIQPARPK